MGEIPERLVAYRREIDALLHRLAAEEKVLLDLRAQRGSTAQSLENTERARLVAQGVANQIQERSCKTIAAVVSRCMRAIFDEPYEMRVTFLRRKNRTEVHLSFARDGLEIDPTSATGGGVVDVASFALRLAALLMSRPPRRRLLLLDEPFRFVSAQYRPRVAQMLEMVAKEMRVQIIMVTHAEELQVGKVIQL